MWHPLLEDRHLVSLGNRVVVGFKKQLVIVWLLGRHNSEAFELPYGEILFLHKPQIRLTNCDLFATVRLANLLAAVAAFVLPSTATGARVVTTGAPQSGQTSSAFRLRLAMDLQGSRLHRRDDAVII